QATGHFHRKIHLDSLLPGHVPQKERPADPISARGSTEGDGGPDGGTDGEEELGRDRIGFPDRPRPESKESRRLQEGTQASSHDPGRRETEHLLRPAVDVEDDAIAVDQEESVVHSLDRTEEEALPAPPLEIDGTLHPCLALLSRGEGDAPRPLRINDRPGV